MFPILYDQITPGTVPQHNGLGVLSDCISCESEQSRNSIYELVFEYPMNGIHAQDIAYRRVVKVKPNPTDATQLYRIKRISKVMNGVFTVYCKHISYDLSGCEITSGNATSAAGACLLLQNAASGYTITTDKVVTADFNIDVPASVRSYFAGKTGSFLDVFGTAEIKYDNFSVQFLTHAGEDRGVEIRYAKNLLELSQEIDCDNLYTHVMCFYKVESTKVVGDKVATGLTLDAPRTLVIDCSNEYDAAPTVATLTARATQFINNNNLTTPTNNIKLDFVQSGELTNRVDLCDTVSIYYEALGITRANVKCIRTKFDCLREKYIETEFGDVKADLTDSFVVATKAIEDKPSVSAMETAINHITKQITGNLGGCVINGHDTNNDGIPDENLIMNTDDITTATKVIRSNIGGIGFSTNGYSGPFTTAIGFDGIVADAITTGVLNANLIKAGVISDVNGNSTIDMTSGVAILKDMKAKNTFQHVDSNGVTRTIIAYNVSDGTSLIFRDASSNDIVRVYAKPLSGGGVTIRNENANEVAWLESDDTTHQGELGLKNTAGNTEVLIKSDLTYHGSIWLRSGANNRIWIGVNSVTDAGQITLNDASGNKTIDINGATGRIVANNMLDKVFDSDVNLSDVGDTWTFTNFACLLIIGKVVRTGSRLSMMVPVEMISTSATRFQLADESNWISFDIYINANDLIEIKIAAKSSGGTGFIEKVYGMF